MPLDHRIHVGLLNDNRGLTTVEYVIILVLVAIGSIATWSVFGQSIMCKVGLGSTAIDGLGDEGGASAGACESPPAAPATPAGPSSPSAPPKRPKKVKRKTD